MSSIADLERQAESDGGAALALAEAVLTGHAGTVDAKRARSLVERSADLGNEDGKRALVYITASGIGAPADREKAETMLAELAQEDRFAAVQHQFLQHLTCEERVGEIEPDMVSEDPHIAIVPKLFSPAECKYLTLAGTPWLERALIIDEATGEGRPDEKRDAFTSSFPPLAEDLVVQSVNRAIATATKTKAEWGEPLTILQYHPGQQYKPHHDAGGLEKPEEYRYWTALIWLNEDYGGGETHFPELNLKVRGGVGDLLIFRNVLDGAIPDKRMLHAGLPVSNGIKWMVSRWIRNQDYLADR